MQQYVMCKFALKLKVIVSLAKGRFKGAKGVGNTP